MKVYAVIAWEVYYPRANNIVKAFTNPEKAHEFRKEYWKKITDPDNLMYKDFCDVIEIEVEE